MNSFLYEGTVRHRRLEPVEHEFRYRLALFYLDLDELPQALPLPLCSTRGWTPIVFRREDHLGDPARPLAECVRDLVEERTRNRPEGPIRILTHPRFFGFGFNPVSFYYIFSADERLETIVAEVNNTPWGEQHCYLIQHDSSEPDLGPSNRSDRSSPPESPAASDKRMRQRFDKTFHVSPFMDMTMDYDWTFTRPGRRLATHFVNLRNEDRFFDVTMALKRRPLTRGRVARTLLRYPLMTHRVVAAIYWQAFRLWKKRAPFFAHPKHSATESLPAETPLPKTRGTSS